MRRILLWGLMLTAMVWLAACGGGGGADGVDNSPKGKVALRLDLAALESSAAPRTMALQAPLTAVKVTLARTGYTDILANLAVSGNSATGTIENLEPGYWHVTANVFSDDTQIFTGEADVQVVAGSTVEAKILFDPVIIEPTTGSLAITVGINPMPGYHSINQQITEIFQNEATGKLYILDSTTGVIAEYASDTMFRQRDILLPQVPIATALSASGDSFFLAYSSGKIYRLNIATGETTLVGDILDEATRMVAVNNTYLLVSTGRGWSSSNMLKVLNVATGQVVSSNNYWYPLMELVLNRSNSMVYGVDTGLSPQDLHRIAVDTSTGQITVADSRYHGDYYIGGTLRIINSGTRVATSYGSTFFSSAVASQDITYAGKLSYGYVDICSDDSLGLLYQIFSSGTKKLLVLNQDNFFLQQSIELLGEPKRIFQTADNIIVITRDQVSQAYYAKVFSKAALGLK